MLVTSARRAWSFLPPVLMACILCDCAHSGASDFFTIRLSTSGKPLKYLATDDGTGLELFISGVTIELTRDGETVARTRDAAPLFAPGSVVESAVQTLPPDAMLTASRGLSRVYPLLAPGTYTMQATLEQRLPLFGLATGKAVSNKVLLTVKEWKPKAYLEKVWDEKIGPYLWTHTVRLVETTEGDTLIYWREDEERRFLCMDVVPVKRNVQLQGAWWAATDKYCHIVCDQVNPRKRVLIMTERGPSSVRVYDLEPAGPVHRAGAGAWIWWLVVPGSGAVAYLWFWLRRRHGTAHSVPVCAKENGGKPSAFVGNT